MNHPVVVSTVKTIHVTDVLCGRGKLCFQHPGNEAFRLLIAQHIDFYQMASTKKAKMQVVARVANIILSRGGRFLIQEDPDINPTDASSCCDWIDGGIKLGKKKVGHALRDAIRGRSKCVMKLKNKKQHTDNHQLSIIPDYIKGPSASSFSSSSTITENEDDDWRDDLDLMLDNLEPEKEWMHLPNMEYNTAGDLLEFFQLAAY